MIKSNQANTSGIAALDYIPVLAWNIATEPKLYRELASNPYSRTAIKITSERFPYYSIEDIARAVALAEPEGRYDRNFRNLPKELQIEKTLKQASESSEISQRLNQFVTHNSTELAQLSQDLIYKILVETAFKTSSLDEIGLKFAQDQRKHIKLLIIGFIGQLKNNNDFTTAISRLPKQLISFGQFRVPNPGKIFSAVALTLVLLTGFFYPALISGGKSLFTYLDKQVIAHGQSPGSGLTGQLNGQVSLVDPQTGRGIPVRLRIPGINVDAAVEDVGLLPGGEMGVPKNTTAAGWFKMGPRPGEVGSAVIDGHFDGRNGKAGVFASLNKLKPGDKLYVEDDKGASLVFVVRESRVYGPGHADEVFRPDDKAYLNLITCDGVWDEAKKSYSKRLVVFADLSQ